MRVSPYPHLAAASSSCRRRCHFVVDESPSSCRVPVAPSSPPCFPRRRRPAASSPRRHHFIAPSSGRRVALRCASVHLRRRRAGLWRIPVHRRGRASRRRHPSVPAHRRRRPSRHRHPSATVQPSAAPSSPQPSSPLNSVSRRTSRHHHRRRRRRIVAAPRPASPANMQDLVSRHRPSRRRRFHAVVWLWDNICNTALGNIWGNAALG